MPLVRRVLPEVAYDSFEAYVGAGGGAGLRAARSETPDAVIAVVDASGLRGRGGAGFPSGRKWRTVVANRAPVETATVVVNGAEGEPGSFKDRLLLRANPYAVLEGALIGAYAVGAHEVIVAVKSSFTTEIARIDAAMTELDQAGWTQGVRVEIFDGPSEYLYGEETALLESIDGRYPFPRVAPPYRRGVEEIVDVPADIGTGSSSAAHVEMAGPGNETVAPPTLVSNTETFANVAGILANGAAWFRSVGTEESPGTIVCTITGCTLRHGVGEFPMGTPLREVIETIGGGARPGRRIVGAMSGVSNAVLTESELDTPLSYESMTAIGSGLGAAGFIVFDDRTDFAALAAGVARFLAVESCGQCAHCKRDGLELWERLERITHSDPRADDRERIDPLLAGIAEGARCNLAYQQQIVVGSILGRFTAEVDAHVQQRAQPAEPEFVAAIVDLEGEQARLDEHERAKQPDWTYDAEYSGQWPADRLDEHRSPQEL